MIFTSITRALIASLAIFLTVFTTLKKRYGRLRSKELLRRHNKIPKFVIDTIN